MPNVPLSCACITELLLHWCCTLSGHREEEMEGKGADEREDGGATGDQAGEPSIDSDTFSRCSISELMRTLRENGVDPVKEGNED